jgi:hypothetical protein
MRRGCLAFNVLTKFDLLQADGIAICANMRSGGSLGELQILNGLH